MLNIHIPERVEGETWEQYKARRALSKRANWHLTHPSIPASHGFRQFVSPQQANERKDLAILGRRQFIKAKKAALRESNEAALRESNEAALRESNEAALRESNEAALREASHG